MQAVHAIVYFVRPFSELKFHMLPVFCFYFCTSLTLLSANKEESSGTGLQKKKKNTFALKSLASFATTRSVFVWLSR